MRGLRRAAAGDRLGSRRSASAAPKALVLSGGPASVYEPGAPRVPDRAARSRDPDAGHLLRDAGDGPGARRQGRGGRVGRVRPHRADPARRRRPAARRPARGAELLDEPPRRGLRGAARASPRWPRARARRSPPARCPTAASTGSSSTPRSSTRPTGPRSSPASCATSPAASEQWSPQSVIAEQVAKIQAQVGEGRVICGLSGGVDSSVAALLVHKAVGEQLTCVFVDHGLMRLNEAEQVVEAFEQFGIPLVHVDAEERFLAKLAGQRRPGDASARSSARSSSASSRRRRRSSRTSATWSRARSTPT